MRLFLCAALLVAACLVEPLYAATPSVVGHVVDPGGLPLPGDARSTQRFCSGRCRTRAWVASEPDRRNATAKLMAIRSLLSGFEPSPLRERIHEILDEIKT